MEIGLPGQPSIFMPVCSGRMAVGMLFYDTHVHTSYSADGVSPLEGYTLPVDEGRIKGIGFAEHIDFLPECGSYGFLDFQKYLDDVESYRNRGYDFHAGGEIDYAKKIEAEILLHMERYKYAYTICSVHMVDGMSVSNRTDLPGIKDRQALRGILVKYHEELEWSIKAPAFDVIGHIGVYKRYMGSGFFEDALLMKEIYAMEDEIARLCVASDKIVEVNSSGLFSPYGQTVPDGRFLREYFKRGGRSISIGSDAHSTEHLGRGLEAVAELARQIGFEYICLPWDREKRVAI